MKTKIAAADFVLYLMRSDRERPTNLPIFSWQGAVDYIKEFKKFTIGKKRVYEVF
jgi:hypothetical protein